MSSTTQTQSQSQTLIIDAASFHPETDILYSKPKLNKSGGKAVSIMNARTKKSLYLSTPLMLTWGANQFVDEKTGKKTYDMSLQFPRDDKTEATEKFLAAMLEMQAKLKTDAMLNSKEWMGKAIKSLDVIEALFHPLLKYSKDPMTGEPDMTKTPTLKVKLNHWDNKFDCEIYDTQGRMLFPDEENDSITPMDLIPKGSYVAAMLQCGGLWFANGKFGCTWKLVQTVVQPKPSMKGRCFINISGEDKAQMALKQVRNEEDEDAITPPPPQQVSRSSSSAAPVSRSSSSAIASLTITEDSDEEDQDQDQEESVPVIVAVPEVVVAVAVAVAEPLISDSGAAMVIKKIVKRKV